VEDPDQTPVPFPSPLFAGQRPLAPTASSDAPGRLIPDRLVHALTSLGYTPSVFALDHDQAVHEAFPWVLRVILGQENHRART
jgi:hypothetical protein